MIDDLPKRLSRDEKIDRAKMLAREKAAELGSGSLEAVFLFADAEWPFDIPLRMLFLDELQVALTQRAIRGDC